MAREPLLALLQDRNALGVRERIYRTCLDAIVTGALQPGQRIASARRLAADWHVARNTVDDALAQLQSEGWIERRVGDGTRVAAALPAARSVPTVAPRGPSAFGRAALRVPSAWGRTTHLGHDPASVPRPVAFAAGLPDLDAFPLDLWRRIAARRARSDGVRALGYPPALGHPALRDALARHLRAARGLACASEQVMICNSAMQAVELIVRVLLDRGDTAWIEDPGLLNVRAILAAAGVRPVAVPLDAAGLDVAAGRRRHARPALILVTPACHYPTGVMMTLERRLELLRAAEACGAWIVEDDHQSDFVHRGRPVAPLACLDPGRTLIVGSFSHVVFPSLRLAWCVVPAPLVDVFEAVRRQLDDHTHAPLQAVLADFIDGGHFAAHVRRMRTLYTERREALRRACARALPPFARLGPLDAGLNAALHLARSSDRAAASRASAHGVVTLPLSRYATDARINGLLLGYAALDARRIAAGVAALARALRA